MKKKYIYLALSLVIIAFAAILLSRQNTSTIDQQFYITDTSNVTKIFLADKEDHTATLSRVDGVWMVNEEDVANSKSVDLLLHTMLRIEIKHPLSKSANQSGLKQMLTNHVKVEIYQNKGLFNLFGMEMFKKERKTKVYYVGGPTQDNTGTLMKQENDDILYITHLPGMNGYLSERYSPIPSNWKSHELYAIPVNEVKRVTVEFPESPEQSYSILNNMDRTFTLSKHPGGEVIPLYDTLRVLSVVAGFGNINYEASLDDMTDHRIDSLFSSTPFRILTLETTDGKRSKLTMYHRYNFEQLLDLDGNPFPYDVDRMYAFLDGSREAMSVQFFVIDEVTRKLEQLAPILFPGDVEGQGAE